MYAGSPTDVYIPKIEFINTSPASAFSRSDSTFDDECPFCGRLGEKQRKGGDPINTFTSNFNYPEIDFSMPTLGQPLRFERSYNSLTTLTDTVIYSKPLGYGWTHNYDMNLTLPQDAFGEPGIVILKAPHGSRLRFADNGDGTYSPFPGVWASLTRLPSVGLPETYVITAGNQTTFTFERQGQATVTEEAKLTADDAQTEDTYGRSVDMSGDKVIIGADGEDEGGTDAGAAYIHARSGITWTQQAKLVPTDTVTNSQFGYSVAIDGDRAIVGAVADDDNGSASGSAYIFAYDGITWTQQAKLVPTDTVTNSRFGHSVAIDGDRAIIGVIGASAAYIFAYNGSAWVQEDKLTPAFTHFQYGYSVAIDGDTAVVGTNQQTDDAPVFVYTRSGSTWSLQAELTASDTIFPHNVGRSVAVRGDTLVIGADVGNLSSSTQRGNAFVFTRSGTSWLQRAKLAVVEPTVSNNYFGFSVDINADEDKIVVGAYNETTNVVRAGSAYIFARDGENWFQIDQVAAITGTSNDYFGYSVAIDGGRVVAGVYQDDDDGDDSGSAYLYEVGPITTRTYMTAMHDPQGNETRFTYSAGLTLTQVSDPISGRSLGFTYNNQGRLETLTDHTGREVSYGYNAGGDLTTVNDTRGLTWTYVYTSVTLTTGQARHLLHEVIDPDGKTVVKTFYDSQARAERQEDGLGREMVDITYDGNDRVVSEAGVVVTDTYNLQSVRIGMARVGGQTESYDFDENYNRTEVVDGNNNPTRFKRNALGQTEVMTDALDNVTRYTYDDQNNLETITDAEERVTLYDYDSQNNLRSVTNALSGTTVYTYNSLDLLLAVRDENGNVTGYGYDSVGNRTVITDALAYTTRYEYDELGRVVTTTDALDKVTVNTYDGGDNLVQVTENYLAGQPQNHDNEYNIIIRYAYDGAGRRTVITDTLGRVTRNIYDGAGQLVQTIQNEHLTETEQNYLFEYNIITSYGYDSLGRQIAITDTLGHVNRTVYEAGTGRLARTVTNYKDGVYDENKPDEDIITRYEYDAADNVVKTISLVGGPEARATCTVYDDLNRVERTLENCVTSTPATPGSYSSAPDEDIATVYEYDDLGNQAAVIDPLGRRTAYAYDALNRVITITNPLSGTTSYRYDAAGNRTRVTDAKDHSTTFAYDALNRVVTTTNALNGQTIVRYDAVGNREQTIDAEQNETIFRYDSLYRLTETEDAETQKTTSTYDALGNRLTQTDAKDRVTKYAYDTLNRLITTTLNFKAGQPATPDTNVTTRVRYDALSRRTQVVDGRGNPTDYSHDQLGRTTVIMNALGHTLETEYDGLGNRRFVTNGEAEVTEYRYDGLSRLRFVEDAEQNTTEFQYNKAGERVAQIDAELVETRYLYDALGRLTEVIENYQDGVPPSIPPSGGEALDEDVKTAYGYDAVGNRTVITNARGFTTTYQYDDLNRRTRMTDALGYVTRYSYDAVGNQKVITDANGIVTIFDYDDVYRLEGIDYSDPSPGSGQVPTPDVTFSYDAVGNRTAMIDGTGTTTYTHDALNRLTGVKNGADQRVGYGYDAVGNRTQLVYPDNRVVTYTYSTINLLDTVTDWNNGQFGYNYDDANRLLEVTLPNGVASDYNYDSAGRLELLSHTTLTQTLALYDYFDLDNVGNRRQMTEQLEIVDEASVGAYLESNGQVVIDAEHFSQRTPGTSHQWQLNSGNTDLQALPDLDVLYQTIDAISNSPRTDYRIDFTTPGVYTVWLRGYAENPGGDSAYVGLDGEVTSLSGFAPEVWGWANEEIATANLSATLSITNTGLYTLSLWMREDGLRVDRLLLTTDTTYIPSGVGPAETARQQLSTTTLTRTLVYTYDNLYRLTDADYSTGEAYAYEYDPVGNRLKQIIDGDTTDYQYDAANRLAQLTASGQTPVSYSFDNNGNLLQTDAMLNQFDAANRLVATSRDSHQLEPMYNGANDRVAAGLQAIQRRKFKVRTTDSDHHYPVAPNQLNQDFRASQANEKWLTDITYIPTDEGWLYLAAVLDLHSRRIVGWAMRDSLHRQLVIEALLMAVQSRQPPPGLLHHSDRGSQYASDEYQALLTKFNRQGSMSRKGNCYDNAPMESFFASLKSERVHHRHYHSRAEAKTDIFEYIELFYNRFRRHSALDFLCPVVFEQLSISV